VPKNKKEPRRLQRQETMSLAEMLADLPKHCAVGTKRNAKGHTSSWIGYKLHLDVADGDIPVTGLLSSASLHDNQAAIPLATITASRVTKCYDLMDTAYDAPEIWEKSRALGHVPIIATHPRSIDGGKAEIDAEAKRQRHAGFCNGRRLVNPFLRRPFAGHLLLSWVGARPPPDGVR
jgi:hypothetical protein